MKHLTEIWNDFVNAGKVDEICALYAENARLLATFAAIPVDNSTGIRAYFEGFTSRPGSGVSFDTEGARRDKLSNELYLYTGTYTFFHSDGGNRQEFPARYSFLADETSNPKILHHHSSLIPSA